MKSYTWEEIAKAKAAEKKLIIETHGLLGALAIELAQALNGQDTPDRSDCVARSLVGDGMYQGTCSSECPLSEVECGYEGEGKTNLISLYTKLYKKARGKKK